MFQSLLALIWYAICLCFEVLENWPIFKNLKFKFWRKLAWDSCGVLMLLLVLQANYGEKNHLNANFFLRWPKYNPMLLAYLFSSRSQNNFSSISSSCAPKANYFCSHFVHKRTLLVIKHLVRPRRFLSTSETYLFRPMAKSTTCK